MGEKLIHQVPLSRQMIEISEWDRKDIIGLNRHEWSNRICGLACIKMAINFFHNEVVELTDLLVLSIKKKSFNNHGLIHKKALEIGYIYGLDGELCRLENKDFFLKILKRVLHSNGLMVVSVAHRFPNNGKIGGHLIIIKGFEIKKGETFIYFNDPSRWGQNNEVVKWLELRPSLSLNTITFYKNQINE